MRTRIPYLTLLVPVLALAQSRARVPIAGEPAPAQSTWLWVLLLVVAAAVLAWGAVRMAGRKGPPTSGPGGIGVGKGTGLPQKPRSI
ncbi:hypothetical protein ACN6A1_24335 [Myxococcus virescens]|uniref:hypothetical protein n=1 Tax=Myxococcus virescens TaxID=83456 RepID=UPI003DA2D231